MLYRPIKYLIRTSNNHNVQKVDEHRRQSNSLDLTTKYFPDESGYSIKEENTSFKSIHVLYA